MGGNGRSAWSRRARDLIEAHVADFGGPDAVKTAQLALIHRAAIMAVELEAIEACMARGESSPETLDLYGRASSNLGRLLESLEALVAQRPAQAAA